MVQSNLRIPKRNPKTLRRPRLLDQLHNNVHRKLTFVCAPAGYGKSTLLVDFAEDVDGAIFWYRITEQDTSLPVFFDNLITAFQTQVNGFDIDLAGAEQTGRKSPRILALALVNAIDQMIGEYGFLILDDYHIVSDCPEIVEFLDHFLEYLPDQLRIVIGSRSVYGIPTAALYIQEQLAVIGTTELAFRPEELQDLCSQYYQINLTEHQTQKIIEESEGWIVAILLALRSESSTIEIPKILGAREHIYHYLANEVVSALPDYLKEFMYATSVVEEFTIPFADYLLEIDNSEEIIKELDELNLFLSDTESGEEVVFRYHQLFAEFLKDRLGEFFESKTRKLHYRAAQWFEKIGKAEQAVIHYLQGGAAERAALVIESCAQEFYISGQFNTLRNWNNLLQESGETGVSTPILHLCLAKHDITQGAYSSGADFLDSAEPVLYERKDFDNYVNLLVTRGMLFRFTGKYPEALETANHVQKLVVEHGLSKLSWNQAERIKGIVSYFLGKFDDAFMFLSNAADAFRADLSHNLSQDLVHDLMMTLADIGHFGMEKGRIFDAQKSFREAVELTNKIPGNFTDIAIAFNNYAFLNFLLGDYVKAWRNYAQGIEATKIYHLDRYQVHIMNGQADVLCAVEEYEEARNLYEEVVEFAERIGENFALIDAYTGLAEVETRTGFFNKALYYAREVARMKSEVLDAPEHAARFGKIYLSMGQLEMARNSFSTADLGLGLHPPVQQGVVDTYFHYACALYLLGEEDRSLLYLQKAFEMAAALGYDQFLVIAARSYRTFLDWAKERWQSPQLNSLLKRMADARINKDQLKAPIEAPPTVESSLQVTALGREVVRLDGDVIQSAKWLSVGARAMFFFILDRKEVTKDQIALEFWPEFSPGKVNSNFHATLWRVRNALGGKHMIEFRGNSYRVNPDVKLYYDVDQFEELIRRLDTNLSETEQRTFLRQSLELYQGEFLLSIDMTWADLRRTELRNMHLNVLDRLANIELTRNNYLEAAQLFDQLIILEPFQDIYHQEKMACLVGMGNVNGARKHYQDYREFLEKEMGVEPDIEITQFYSNL